MRKLKKILLVLLMLIIAFAGYVEIINQNSVNMTYRQKVLKAVYPVWMWLAGKSAKSTDKLANKQIAPPVSFYSLKATKNDGSILDFNLFKGKKVLIVNTASDCGFTNQYEDLQKLYETHSRILNIVAFPANDFKQQEKGSDEEIAAFCKLNYGITFPLMKKSVVIKNENQNEVFKWLTDSSRNGWNNNPPSWNFTKFLVNEEGKLVDFYGPAVDPMDKAIVEALDDK